MYYLCILCLWAHSSAVHTIPQLICAVTNLLSCVSNSASVGGKGFAQFLKKIPALFTYLGTLTRFISQFIREY